MNNMELVDEATVVRKNRDIDRIARDLRTKIDLIIDIQVSLAFPLDIEPLEHQRFNLHDSIAIGGLLPYAIYGKFNPADVSVFEVVYGPQLDRSFNAFNHVKFNYVVIGSCEK